MKSRRILAILVCLVLMVSMAVAASAATSKTFFSKKAVGYQCNGYGSINSNVSSAGFNATALPMQQIVPDADCVSSITIVAYDVYGDEMVSVTATGDVNAYATCTALDAVDYTKNTFVFNGAGLGVYNLYAN